MRRAANLFPILSSWSAEQWKPILRSIHVQKRDQGVFFFSAPNGPTLPAFTPGEVDYLSETLTRAFAQAQPSEVVVFGLTSPKTQEIDRNHDGGALP